MKLLKWFVSWERTMSETLLLSHQCISWFIWYHQLWLLNFTLYSTSAAPLPYVYHQASPEGTAVQKSETFPETFPHYSDSTGNTTGPSALQDPGTCWGEDVKMGEPLHSENPGNLPLKGTGGQDRRICRIPFQAEKHCFPSLQVILAAFQHQSLKCQHASGICLQVTPACHPHPPTCRHACWRLQMNPFIFTRILGPNALFNNLRTNYTSSWIHHNVQARPPWNRRF